MRPFYLYNGNPYIGKVTYLYEDSALHIKLKHYLTSTLWWPDQNGMVVYYF